MATTESDISFHLIQTNLANMHEAIVNQEYKLIVNLLDKGVSPNAMIYDKTTERQSPLIFLAAQTGNLAIVKLFIERGAVIEKAKYGDIPDFYINDPIRAAIANGHADLAHYLLDCGSNASGTAVIKKLFEIYRQSDVDPIVEQNYLHIIKLVFDNGADFSTCFYYALDMINREYEENLVRLEHTACAEDITKIQHDNTQLLRAYEQTLRVLFDFGTGNDFPLILLNPVSHEWKYFKLINLSAFNFIGLSLRANPISRDMLKKFGISKGIDEAIFTLNDLNNLSDESRKHTIKTRLELQISQRKGWVEDSGIVTIPSLVRAAHFGRVALVEKKLQSGIDPNEKDQSYIAIEQAAIKGHLNIVKMLAEHPATNPKDIYRALKSAQLTQRANVINYLRSRLDPNAEDENEMTQLCYAVIQLNVPKVDELLKKGADPNKGGVSPLWLATSPYISSRNFRALDSEEVHKLQAEIVALLLQYGADPNKYDFKSPLADAVAHGNIRSVALLLPLTENKNLARICEKNDKTQSSPWYEDMLFDAINNKNCIPILSLLKDSGADFNVLNPGFGDTNLLCTVILSTINGRSRDLFCYLLRNGASANFLNRDRSSPLHYTIKQCQKNNEEAFFIIEELVSFGADMNALDTNGRTPMQIAASSCNTPLCQLLEGLNAKITASSSSSTRDDATCSEMTEPTTSLLGHDEPIKKTLKSHGFFALRYHCEIGGEPPEKPRIKF
ncbi:ankyrin repeat domain-containing protein [Legionella worsleiensis]|uniref:Ankyrin repeats (3 copies) n=1 Tax=Legionella worsleiensis TaxID=45076 RepID=A0A0W1AGA0_9GAMM|nr:ankyrin repeat domain-containing protein [Legionella worsleiensis]KTD80347.1 Ankyrin repeats (3 copies) [Legionella worsleiensis]STY32752.1 Ribulose-5-phosphate 4-epimerase and related epimerases and aldolases [Legionella worsleiensis]